MAVKPIFGPGSAGCCTVISLFGVLILALLGLAFENNAEALLGHRKNPDDGRQVARICYTTAVVYAVFAAFCACQIGVHKRHARGGQVGHTTPSQPLHEAHELIAITSRPRGRRR